MRESAHIEGGRVHILTPHHHAKYLSAMNESRLIGSEAKTGTQRPDITCCERVRSNYFHRPPSSSDKHRGSTNNINEKTGRKYHSASYGLAIWAGSGKRRVCDAQIHFSGMSGQRSTVARGDRDDRTPSPVTSIIIDQRSAAQCDKRIRRRYLSVPRRGESRRFHNSRGRGNVRAGGNDVSKY